MTGALNRDRRLRSWARSLVAANETLSPIELATAVASRVRVSVGAPPLDRAHDLTAAEDGAAPDRLDPPDGWEDPWLPGIVHEQAVSPERRTARGAWYTPKSVVEGLIRLAMPDDRPLPAFVADPTCGGGAFLLAALDHLVAAGRTPAESLASVGGQDIDPDAAAVSRLALNAWAAANGVETPADSSVSHAFSPERLVAVGDALADYPDWWPAEALIIGNPPFGSPLRAGAIPKTVAQFREGREHLLGPYADLAAVHLLAAIERSAPGSTVALVQPQSILSGRDTAGLRAHCVTAAPLRALWTAREAVFDAGVRACAVVVTPGAEPSPVVLAAGPDVTELAPPVEPSDRPISWSGLAATSLGAPALPPTLVHPPAERSCLGELITATAGFRDEYYGLVAACQEWEGAVGEEPNRLLTVGAVEPLASLWGIDAAKFGRRRWVRPTIDLNALDEKVRTWTERQMVPKIVLATQSRVLEPVVDRSGTLIPATPLLSIHTEDQSLDLVAAVLLAPPVVAWAWQQWFGAAMAVDALKLAAKQVSQLPLPSDRGAWEEAAAIVADTGDGDNTGVGQDDVSEAWGRACLVAEVMNRAYEADEAVYRWWLDRSKRPVPTDDTSRHAAQHAG